MGIGKRNNRTGIKFIVTATFLLMIAVNALANILPINGVTTGQVSDAYPNLFAPAPFTFAIWGLIYLLLAGYTVYQLGMIREDVWTASRLLLKKISISFSVSSLANTAWVFSWHYDLIPLSMVFMVVILICLIKINQLTAGARLIGREYFFIRLPFSVYFGWITVATIANATVLLVSLGWSGFGLPEPVWATVMIAAGFVIGAAAMLKNKDKAYGLVLIWAFFGILMKHILPDGFDGQYPMVIATSAICIVLVVCAEILLIARKRK
jgi:hypothetical protein